MTQTPETSGHHRRLLDSRDHLRRTRRPLKSSALIAGEPEGDVYDTYLLPNEEKMLYRHHEFLLREFCKKFSPPVPK